ncbi:hypothetical protein [Treponema primitia]|uniref:hypothetical protein n=1 Tax=Treponema primitia TaxID=88058 RepID=UPI0002554C0B|nr:hypothetical protein [Treponema primitia]
MRQTRGLTEVISNAETLFDQIKTDIAKELEMIPPHGKIRFELTFRDYHLQRLLTTREVSHLYDGSDK